jgi:imidazolonepropionase-like amidohydrolase
MQAPVSPGLDSVVAVGTERDAIRVGGVVLPGGERHDLYVVDGVVTYHRVRDARTLADDVWVVPGLVDAHCHVGLGSDGAVDRDEQLRQAIDDRDAGTLLIRDCGAASDTRWMDECVELPRILRAGRHLARPKRYLRDVGIEVEPDQLADAVDVQARWGDGWVKLVGDWIDRDLGDLAPCWPLDALTAAVDRAHAHGARVTVHVFGEEALDDLLSAGVDCIEHGTGCSDAQLATMAANGVALVPTLINIDTFPGIAQSARRFPRYAEHMLALHSRASSMVATARDLGVEIYAGTDAGGGITHGRIADEVVALSAAGMGADAALGAASWSARSWLGQGGGLGEGESADFVVYPADPRADLDVLHHPSFIVLRGNVVSGGSVRALPRW